MYYMIQYIKVTQNALYHDCELGRTAHPSLGEWHSNRNRFCVCVCVYQVWRLVWLWWSRVWQQSLSRRKTHRSSALPTAVVCVCGDSQNSKNHVYSGFEYNHECCMKIRRGARDTYCARTEAKQPYTDGVYMLPFWLDMRRDALVLFSNSSELAFIKAFSTSLSK